MAKKVLTEAELRDALREVIVGVEDGGLPSVVAWEVARRYSTSEKTLTTYYYAVMRYFKTKSLGGSTFGGSSKLARVAKVLYRERGGEVLQGDSDGTMSALEGNPIDLIVRANELFADGVEGLMAHFDRLEKDNKELRLQVQELSMRANEVALGSRIERLSRQFALSLGR